MNNLIKNELIKLLHNKGLYVYISIISIILLFSFINIKDEELNELQVLEKQVNSYNEEDKGDLKYIDIVTNYNTLKLASKYPYNSFEFYYIDTEIKPIIYNVYYSKYYLKDNNLYIKYQRVYNNLIKGMDKIKWKDYLEDKKKLLNSKIKSSSNEEQIKLKYQLEGIEYSLKLDITPSYSNESKVIGEYVTNAYLFNLYDKTKLNLLNDNELTEYYSIKEKYKINKYKIDHNLNTLSNVESDLSNNFKTNYFAMLLYDINNINDIYYIGLLIIFGNIIAIEFINGTIKQLLIRPYKRKDILLSKLIAGSIVFIGFIILYNIIYSLLGNIILGNVNIFNKILIYNFKKDKVIESSYIIYYLINLISLIPIYLIYILIIILIGIISTSVTSTISMGFLINVLIGMFDVIFNDKVKSYIPFYIYNINYLIYGKYNLNKYINGFKTFLIFTLWILLLSILNIFIFSKKEIKNK